jgi:NDP-mannose synthase
VRAVILAGGTGTRFRPYTTVLPKPLIPVGNRPILDLILARLVECGVSRVDLCTGYLGELIEAYVSQSDTVPAEIELRWFREDEPLGTAGALRLIPDLEGSFLVMNGDVLTDLDLVALTEFHREQDAALTIAIHSTEVALELGIVERDGAVITEYREKPVLRYEVSSGVYAFHARALDHLPEGPCQFPELVIELLRAGERVAAYPTDAEVLHIGTVDQHEQALRALEGRSQADHATG